MVDVFVSYARDDRAKVEQIAKALEGRGFDVWWDPELLPGETYAQKIQTVLQTAKAVLVVWSKTSAARPWVLDEAAVGLNRGILVPILIDKIEAPLGFRQLQTEDLSQWPGAAAPNFERLVAALQRLRQDPGQPTPPRPVPPPPPPTPRIGRRAGLIAGGVVIAGLALLALNQVIGPGNGGQDVPVPDPGDSQLVNADGLYGLTTQEIVAEDVDKLIAKSVQAVTLDTIRQGAGEGDTLGQALMCLAYDFGQGTTPDALAARGWCERSSDGGHHLGQFLMSWAYRVGNYGVPVDLMRAQTLLNSAADNGDARAMGFIGTAYLNGTDGYPNDNVEALSYLRRAAELGHKDSQFNLAWMYENGRGVTQDYPTALLWYRKLADEGEAIGVRAVGWMTYQGWGVPRDAAKAAELYAQASDMGDWAASRNLALLYENGDGVTGSLEEAKRYLRIAESQACTAGNENSSGCTSVMADLKRLGLTE